MVRRVESDAAMVNHVDSPKETRLFFVHHTVERALAPRPGAASVRPQEEFLALPV